MIFTLACDTAAIPIRRAMPRSFPRGGESEVNVRAKPTRKEAETHLSSGKNEVIHDYDSRLRVGASLKN